MGEGRITALARKQCGVFTREQAFAAGMTRNAISWRLEHGDWELAYRGIYRLPVFPNSWEQRLRIALLALGDRGVVSHRSAAALWHIDGFSRREMELSTSRPRRQIRVRNKGELLGRVDLGWEALKVFVEVDSLWHLGLKRVSRDHARRNDLVAAGWRPLTVMWKDVVRSPAKVIETVRETLQLSLSAQSRSVGSESVALQRDHS